MSVPHISLTRLVVVIVPSWTRGPGEPAPALGRQKLVFPHQPQNSSFRGSDASMTKSSPDFAISFPMKGDIGQDGLDMLHQFSIATRPLGAGSDSCGGWSYLGLKLPIDGRAVQAPDTADPDQGIGFLRGGRGGPADLLGLRGGKGKPFSSRSIFFWRSSLSMVTSPNFCWSWAISRSRASLGYFFRAAPPGFKKLPSPFEIRAAVTPISLESSSRSSPRKRRKTISSFRRVEKRCDPLPTRPGSSPVALRAPSNDPGLASPSLFRSIEAPPRVSYFTLIGVQKNCRPMDLYFYFIGTWFHFLAG